MGFPEAEEEQSLAGEKRGLLAPKPLYRYLNKGQGFSHGTLGGVTLYYL